MEPDVLYVDEDGVYLEGKKIGTTESDKESAAVHHTVNLLGEDYVRRLCEETPNAEDDVAAINSWRPDGFYEGRIAFPHAKEPVDPAILVNRGLVDSYLIYNEDDPTKTWKVSERMVKMLSISRLGPASPYLKGDEEKYKKLLRRYGHRESDDGESFNPETSAEESTDDEEVVRSSEGEGDSSSEERDASPAKLGGRYRVGQKRRPDHAASPPSKRRSESSS
jgi:hypothetical protein